MHKEILKKLQKLVYQFPWNRAGLTIDEIQYLMGLLEEEEMWLNGEEL